MAKKKELLFQLIKSLNKEEKRHFKLYVNKYNSSRENNYLKLFNAIGRQDVYDEAAIKEQFRNETFVKQLTVTKHYLQKQILRSLQNLHYDDTVDLSMLALHHQVAVMFKKGQYEICRELVKKGLEVSSKNERFLEWIGFLKWDLDLINKMDIAEYKRSIADYLDKTSKLLSWYEITIQGNHLSNQFELISLNTPSFGMHSTHYEILINKIENLGSTIDIDSLPLKARLKLRLPLALSYLSIADYPKAYELYRKLCDELSNEFVQKELHEQYINVLTGLIYSSNAVSKSDETKMAIKELKLVPELNHHIAFRKAESLAFYPLINCALGGDVYNGLIAIEIMEAFLITYKEKMTPVQCIYAYYYSALLYLGSGNNTLALKYLRKADAFQNKELLPNLRLAVSMMEITIFYDQGKFDLVESRLRSLQRQLQKEKNVKAFLKYFLKYFQKLINHESGSDQTVDLYRRFLKDLLGMSFSDQISLFLFFDMISWLQSKIDGCTLGEKLQLNAARLFSQVAMG